MSIAMVYFQFLCSFHQDAPQINISPETFICEGKYLQVLTCKYFPTQISVSGEMFINELTVHYLKYYFHYKSVWFNCCEELLKDYLKTSQLHCCQGSKIITNVSWDNNLNLSKPHWCQCFVTFSVDNLTPIWLCDKTFACYARRPKIDPRGG